MHGPFSDDPKQILYVCFCKRFKVACCRIISICFGGQRLWFCEEWVCAKLFWDSVFNAWDLVISVSSHFLIKPYYTCDMLFASKILRMHSIRFVHSLVGEMPVLLVQTGSDVYWGLLLPFSKLCHLSIVAVLVMRILLLFTRLMFPLALTAQYFGMSNSRMSLNVLARSFPWIGIHVDVLRTGGRRMWPLFRSHMLFLLIQSFVPGRFQSCSCYFKVLNYGCSLAACFTFFGRLQDLVVCTY